MAYELDCDTCEYTRVVEAERDTYVRAKAHEKEHPEHFVLITTRQ